MADAIFEVLVSFFCPTSDAASTCNEFISNHSQVLPPLGPMFYFLLFPLVFTILFVYILSSTILHYEGKVKWIQPLIGISVFIFIIINGWYPIMLFLSEVWFIMIIILFGMWYFIGKHRGGSGGGGGSGGKGGMPGLALGGALGAIMTKKQEHDELKLAESSLDLAKSRLEAIRSGNEPRPSDAMQQIEDSLTSATGAINRLLLDPVHVHKAKQLESQKNHLLEEIKHLKPHIKK
jgi:hypothetical protein